MSATMIRTDEIPALTRAEAMRLADAEYDRFDDLLATLEGADWAQPTDCDRWNVKQVVSHLVQMGAAMTSMRELIRQQRAGKPLAASEGLSSFDAWTEYQATSLADLDPSALVDHYRRAVPRALAVRGRTSPLRLLRFPSPPYGWFSMAYLRDDILTRDVWMHRVDISRAVGRDLVLTPEHDGRFVANVVRDLASRWGRPFTLDLSGPAGGTYVHGTGGDTIRLDAVECCRILSGRSTGGGLPTDLVPF